MKKKTILIILIVAVLLGVIISLYSTFAFNEEASELDKSTADYNLIYSIKEQSTKQINITPGEEKYINITLNNPYESTVKYGMYYYIEKQLPKEITISLAEDSEDGLTDTILSNETKNISIKITNQADYSVDLEIGALVGFENGDIADLIQNGETLIK